jgi:riboflavin kinase/FMN adenylyltransferase
MTEAYVRVSQLTEVTERRPTYLAVGVFDGVHLGHQQLLQSMVSAARASGSRSAVLTFFPHPGTIIHNRQGRLYLTALDDRVNLIAEQGVELIITYEFDEATRLTSAREFIDRVNQNLNLSELWGGNFSLGHKREGDLTYLRQLGQDEGFEVRHFSTIVDWNGVRVSSSRIRRSLELGDVADVSGCLGRPYRLNGKVIQGDGRGRPLGIPTANLAVWDELALPAAGVYATYAWINRKKYSAATNVGYRPTVNGRSLSVEAHLLEFDAEIYGQEIALDFVNRIRDEKKFPGIDALVTQIKADIEQVRETLTPLKQ